jgi:hypothetical protein
MKHKLLNTPPINVFLLYKRLGKLFFLMDCFDFWSIMTQGNFVMDTIYSIF